jgi:menaquinone-9 beta-reductase
MPDVTIIGAGPAGCLAAVALARDRWAVTLVEQARFPRHKVCGESLSALGVEVLERFGLDGAIRRLDPIQITKTSLHAADGPSVVLDLPKPMWGVSRRAFDAALLDAAIDAGAMVIQPARCELISPALELCVRRLDTNSVELHRASAVLLADGKGALLPTRPRPTTDFGVKAHFEQVAGPRVAVELFGVAGHYVGLAPIEGGLSNIAFSVPIRRLRTFRDDLDALWTQLLTENSALSDRFGRARRVGGWLASPLPRFAVAREWPAGVIPLGNAAAALEPIGGEGMGLALRSAELAAGALQRAHLSNAPVDVHRLRTEFARLWRARRLACRALANVLSRPALSAPLLDWAAVADWMPRAAMALIGKR